MSYAPVAHKPTEARNQIPRGGGILCLESVALKTISIEGWTLARNDHGSFHLVAFGGDRTGLKRASGDGLNCAGDSDAEGTGI